MRYDEIVNFSGRMSHLKLFFFNRFFIILIFIVFIYSVNYLDLQINFNFEPL